MASYDEIAASQSIYKFLDYYGITNDQGEVLDFADHAYMWDIYGDFSPYQAYLKAAQVTMSTCINIKAFFVARNMGTNDVGFDIIYSLPSSSDINQLVSAKTNRLIANNPIFQDWTSDKDTIDQKKIGKSVIYYRGTWTEMAALAIPADLYISDETDRSKQDIVRQYKTRLQHSKYGWQWYLSNPSASGNGVDKHWELSDQKHWFIACKHCGHEWYLTMENIMYKDGKPYFGCLKCNEELDRHKGRWIAKHKDRTWHPVSNPDGCNGYWISLLMPPRITAKYILEKKKELSEEQFANFVLGQPYVGRGNKLTQQMFLQNLIARVNPRDCPMLIGVDTGKGINYVLGNKHGLFYYDKIEDYSYEPLRKLMIQFPSAMMIIDQGGDIIGPRKLREEFPNRVYLCFFRADQKNDKIISWNDDEGTVTADRNKGLQLLIDEMIDKRFPIYGTEAEWHEVWLEFSGMYRTEEESNLQTPVFKWNKPSTGRCDYPFCFLYYRIGMDRFLDAESTFHEAKQESFAQTGFTPKP